MAPRKRVLSGGGYNQAVVDSEEHSGADNFYDQEGANFSPLYNKIFADMYLAKAQRDQVNKAQSFMYDPAMGYYGYGIPEGVLPKRGRLLPDTLRRLQYKSPTINMIIRTRVDQVMQFMQVSRRESEKGFVVRQVNKDRTPTGKEVETCRKCELFLMKLGDLTLEQRYISGWQHKADYGLKDLISELIWDLLVLDTISIELQKDKRRNVRGMLYADSATIFRVIDPLTSRVPGLEQSVFIQLAQNEMKAKYSFDEMIFSSMNRRADIRFAGYGYPPIEMALDNVLGHIMGFEYNMGVFSKNKMPQGMLLVKGPRVTQNTLRSLERYWSAMMHGIDGQHNFPILGVTNNEEIKYEKIRDSNRQMEFTKWMDTVLSHVLAVFGMSADEIGIKLEGSQRTVYEDTKNRISASKDRGLGNLLRYLGDVFTKIIQHMHPDLEVAFTGVDFVDQKLESETIKSQLEAYMTLNEILKSKDLKPLVGHKVEFFGKEIEVGDIPALFNPTFKDFITQNAQQGQGEFPGENGFPGQGGGENGQGGENGDPAKPGAKPEFEMDEGTMKATAKNFEGFMKKGGYQKPKTLSKSGRDSNGFYII